VLCKPIATQALATPRNAFIVLPLLILQQFWAYRNTFDVLQQRVNLVVMFEEIIFPRFGVPKVVISDGGAHFIDKRFK